MSGKQEEASTEADTVALKWERVLMNGVAPKARGGAAVGCLENLIILFGGHFYGGKGKFNYMNDVWVIDIDTLTWHQPKCAFKPPGVRYGASASIIGHKMYIFGGKGPDDKFYNDLWALNIDKWSWEVIPSSTAPPAPRFNHASCVVDGKIVIHGGWDERSLFSDLWVFDLDSSSWVQPRIGGPAPAARHGHSLSLSPDGRLLVFGGMTFDERKWPKYLKDTRQLNTETMEWEMVRVTGDLPSERYWHGMCMVEDYMFVVGGYTGGSSEGRGRGEKKVEQGASSDDTGVFILDAAEMHWGRPKVVGTGPCPRYGHSLVQCGPKLVSFGGWDGNKPRNDVMCLDLSSMMVDEGPVAEGSQIESQEP